MVSVIVFAFLAGLLLAGLLGVRRIYDNVQRVKSYVTSLQAAITDTAATVDEIENEVNSALAALRTPSTAQPDNRISTQSSGFSSSEHSLRVLGKWFRTGPSVDARITLVASALKGRDLGWLTHSYYHELVDPDR